MPISVGKRAQKYRATHAHGCSTPDAKEPAALVVINLQKTDADQLATLRIGAKIDDVVLPLMRALGISIPSFKLRRTIRVLPPDTVAIEGAEKTTKPLSSDPAIRRRQLEHRAVTAGSAAAAVSVRGFRDGWSVSGVDEDGTAADTIWNVQATFTPKSPQPLSSTSSVTQYEAKQEQEPILVPVQVVLGQDCRPFRGRGGGRGNINKKSKPMQERAHLRPGDRGAVVSWPWFDGGRGGKVLVRGISGALAGSEYTVSADICSVIDRNPQSVAPKSGQRDVTWIANAGSAQGKNLEHKIVAPAWHVARLSLSSSTSTEAAKHGGVLLKPDEWEARLSKRQQLRLAEAQSLELSSMILMFRSHYGEPPFSIPVKELPQPGEKAKLFVLEYCPTQGDWEYVT